MRRHRPEQEEAIARAQRDAWEAQHVLAHEQDEVRRNGSIVRLTAENTSGKYTQTFRRVCAIVEVNGESREMTFLTGE